jgi:type 1 fimbria pilin
MTVDTFTSNPSGTGTLSGGAQTLNVGATLHVAGAQAAGNYTGTYNVTVAYQ